MTKAKTKPSYVLCVETKDCEDLLKGKVYLVLADPKAKREGYIRVIDESGEDYLYPESIFVPVEIPVKAREALGAMS